MAAAAVYKGTEPFRAGDYATVTALFTTVCLHFLLELIITLFYVHRTQDVTFEGLDHWRSTQMFKKSLLHFFVKVLSNLLLLGMSHEKRR